METTEIWLPVVGYENHYEVSNLGNVRRKSGSDRCKLGRPRSPVPRGKYLQVILSKNGEIRLHWVHRLVALAFLGNPPDNCDRVNHIDGNGFNNRVHNLEWTNHSGNMRHAYRTGLLSPSAPKGEANGYSKLTEQDVRSIRELYGTEKTSVLAKRFGVDRTVIYNVAKRKRWKHVV